MLEKDAGTATVVVGPREALAVTRVLLERPAAPPGPEAVRAVRLRYGAAPSRAGRGAAAAGWSSSCATGACRGPGQLACLMSGELVAGFGTIAEAR